MSFKCKIGLHSWDGCKCAVCDKSRDYQHDWSKDCEKCSKCGKSGIWGRIEIGSICPKCGKKILSSAGLPYCFTCKKDFPKYRHDWSKDCEKCHKCDMTRENQHSYSKDCRKCSKCGKPNDVEHSWVGCKCTKCAITRNEQHDWSKNCEQCSKCGIVRNDYHKWDGCKCTICGTFKSSGHKWEGKKCTVCGTNKTTPSLEKLKVALGGSTDANRFLQEIKWIGYVVDEQTPWGSVVMQHGQDRIIISIKSESYSTRNTIFNLIYSNRAEDVKLDLVNEGKIVY